MPSFAFFFVVFFAQRCRVAVFGFVISRMQLRTMTILIIASLIHICFLFNNERLTTLFLEEWKGFIRKRKKKICSPVIELFEGFPIIVVGCNVLLSN